MTKARVLVAASGFFVTSFLMSGNGNVLPQLFFQRFHAERKVFLLAVCLLVGTCGGAAGVLASRRTVIVRWRAILVVLATLAAEGSLFLLRDAAAYVALNAVAQFGANYLTNQIDHAAVAGASDARRRLHDGASNVARLLGILAAPAFFSRFAERTAVVLSVLVAAAVVALASAGSLTTRPATGEPKGVASRAAGAAAAPPKGQGSRALDLPDRLFFGYAFAVYVALYLLAANLIYLLRDFVHLDDAARRGGTALVVVFFCALVTNAVAAARRRGERARLGSLAAPAGVLAVAAATFSSGASLPFAVIIVGCALIGTTYGLFLAEVRDHASRGARERGKIELLTLFNNLGNVSSLGAFAFMVALAAALRDGAGTHRWVLGFVGLAPVLALPLLFAATSSRARRVGT